MELCLVSRLPDAAWAPDAALREDWRRLAAAVGRPDWLCEVVWVADARMAELNGRYRGRPEVTDVLSFSELATDGEGEPDLAAGTAGAAVDLWREGPVDDPQVGTLVLAPLFIVRRCRENGWDTAAEWRLLVAHGLLHLLGWVHDTPAQRRLMRTRERELLAVIGCRHPLSTEG